MAAGSGVDVRIHAGKVPTLTAARLFAGAEVVPGGTLNNLPYAEPHVTFAPEVSQVDRVILADAQTSGGLLISLPAGRAGALLAALHTQGVSDAALIGEITSSGTGHITVAP